MDRREYIEWADIWTTGADTVNGAPRLLMVGDSITRSYFERVEKRLEGRLLCSRLTTSRSICDQQFEKELRLLMDEFEYSIIHFNNGLHGWCYSEKEYASSLKEKMNFLLSRCASGRIILATTTPVWQSGCGAVLAPNTERVKERNRIAVELASSAAINVNDLFGTVMEHPEYISEDGVHFKPAGQDILGEKVAGAVLAVAGKVP